MKILKKLICTMLCAVLTLGILPTSAFAETVQQIDVEITASKSWVYTKDDELGINIELTGIPVPGVSEPNDVVMIIDRSGSMSNDISNMKTAAKNFIKTINMDTHRVGIVIYDDRVESMPITDDADALCAYIDNVTARGGTRIEMGINEALALLKNKRPGVTGSMVLMTDGLTVDQAAAVAAAEKAKQQGNFFYTVALCKDVNSQENLNLKKMATSEADHYSVFYSSGLGKVYNQLAKKIGKCNPKDLIITQVIDSSFEYVPGSADNNTPVPVIQGNKITWTMNQLGEGVAPLSYKVRAKNNATVGTKPVSHGTITYTDYNGNAASVDFPVKNTKLKYNPPEITSIESVSGKITDGETISVKGKYFLDGAELQLNGVKMAIQSQSDSELTFVMPKGAKKASTVAVYNPDGQWYSVALDVFQTPTITKLAPNHGDEKTLINVRITGTGFDGTSSNVCVLIGDQAATISSVDTTSIRIKTPETLTKGVYDVTVINSNGASVTFPDAYTADEVYLPESPKIIKTEEGNGTVTLTWEPIDGAEKYRIYTFDEKGNMVRQDIAGGAETTVIVKHLKNDVKYNFGVETYACGKWGGIPSASASATPQSPISLPPEKAVITSISASGTTATVTWKPVEGAVKYRIYAFPNGKGTAKVEIAVGTNTVTLKKLKAGTNYGFWVEPYTSEWAGKPDPKIAAFDFYKMP